jgi:hypothetical protein
MNPGAVRLDAALRQEIDRLIATLPPLPPVVRYYDDFENEMRSIRLDANDYTISIDRVPASGVASAIAVPSGQSRELVSLRLAG